jgi:hypothetical protein
MLGQGLLDFLPAIWSETEFRPQPRAVLAHARCAARA